MATEGKEGRKNSLRFSGALNTIPRGLRLLNSSKVNKTFQVKGPAHSRCLKGLLRCQVAKATEQTALLPFLKNNLKSKKPKYLQSRRRRASGAQGKWVGCKVTGNSGLLGRAQQRGDRARALAGWQGAPRPSPPHRAAATMPGSQ